MLLYQVFGRQGPHTNPLHTALRSTLLSDRMFEAYETILM